MEPLHDKYIDEIENQRGKSLYKSPMLFEYADIGSLPVPVKRYLRACRFMGTPRRLYGQLQWNNVRLKLSRSGKWRSIRCYEFLAAPEPLRIVHMTTGRGFLPGIEARDKYQDGRGSLEIRLGGFIPLTRVRGKEVDQSELVTILAAAPLLPAFFLQPYIHWTEIDRHTVSAAIACNGITASGLFFFNDRDEFIRFETDDRWETRGRGKFRQTHWQATATDYVEDGSIRRPTKLSAAWVDGNETFEYFKGELGGIL
jgi:hypothetical protein